MPERNLSGSANEAITHFFQGQYARNLFSTGTRGDESLLRNLSYNFISEKLKSQKVVEVECLRKPKSSEMPTMRKALLFKDQKMSSEAKICFKSSSVQYASRAFEQEQ